MTTASDFIQTNLITFINNHTIHKVVPYVQENENNVISKEIDWLMSRCDNSHDVKTFEGTLPHRMAVALGKLGHRYTVFANGLVYSFNIRFGSYVSNQNKVYFSYEAVSFNDFFIG